jgi:nitric oxide reductase NorE protein
VTLLNASGRAATERRVPGEEGVWVLVLGDMTVFALFFATFMYSRGKNRGAFAQAHDSMLITLGAINTTLLLTSSLFVALAVARAMAERHVDSAPWFVGALCCGVGFVGVKAVEWTWLFGEGKGVGSGEFYSYYFVFTGIHLGHVVIGIALLLRLVVIARQRELSAKNRRFCETGGIFWHMVDLLWVVLFALFYLVR